MRAFSNVSMLSKSQVIASTSLQSVGTTLAKRSTFWVFWPESDDVNLDKITIFYCLNCISECINGFNMLKKPRDTPIIQT
jgi:hypothetical protein